jgi:hypothetical protein
MANVSSISDTKLSGSLWIQRSMTSRSSRGCTPAACRCSSRSLSVSSPVIAVAGKDATEAFYGLHRHEVLEKPQYKRLQIGTVKDEKPAIYARVEGAISDVPYAEPTWLSKGYHSPYYKDVGPSPSIFYLLLTNLATPIVEPSSAADCSS